MESGKLPMQVMQNVPTKGFFIYNMPVNFYAVFFTNYTSHFSFVYELILNNSCLLL